MNGHKLSALLRFLPATLLAVTSAFTSTCINDNSCSNASKYQPSKLAGTCPEHVMAWVETHSRVSQLPLSFTDQPPVNSAVSSTNQLYAARARNRIQQPTCTQAGIQATVPGHATHRTSTYLKQQRTSKTSCQELQIATTLRNKSL